MTGVGLSSIAGGAADLTVKVIAPALDRTVGECRTRVVAAEGH